MWTILRIEGETSDSLINLDHFHRIDRHPDVPLKTRLWIDRTNYITVEKQFSELVTLATT